MSREEKKETEKLYDVLISRRYENNQFDEQLYTAQSRVFNKLFVNSLLFTHSEYLYLLKKIEQIVDESIDNSESAFYTQKK